MRKLYGSLCLVIILLGAVLGAYFFLRPRESRARLEDVEVLAIVAEGSDYWELHYVNQTLAGEGASLTTASFAVGEVSTTILRAQISFDNVDVTRYDVIFIPGGSGPRNIIYHPDRQKVFDILAQANDQGKLIAAICHGPWVLAAADLVDGKNVTCYNQRAMVDDLTDSGANVNAKISVIQDGNIITANGPHAINVFTEMIINALNESSASV